MRKLLLMVALVALVGAGCGSDDGDASNDAPPVSLAGTTNDHGTETAGEELKMELDDNYFGPTYVRAEAGQRFTVELENEGANVHTFTSPALGIDEEVAAGAKKTVTVTAPAGGSAEFHCRFHQAAGMQGAVFIG